MTDAQFTELVNLYLDKEISADDLKLLKDELASDPERKRAFAERCKLHQAMRLAMNPKQKSGRSSSRHKSRSGSRSRSRQFSSRSDTRFRRVDEKVESKGVSHFPRWLLGSGIAASILIAFILLPPVFRDTTSAASQPELVGVTKEELLKKDPLDTIGKSELRRFANVRQQRLAQQHTSLVAQMRLLGLRPELTPQEKQLQEVSLAAVQRPERRISQAELFQRIQELRAIPEQQLLKIEETPSASARWPGGFGTSLVSFEN